MQNRNLSISSTAKSKLPRLPFLRMKEAILGPRYELSVASVGSSVSRRLNRVHRGKDKPANVLSFPLSKHSGEILLDLAQARKDASLFAMSPRAFLGRLFIHGALHLKGFAHGGIMEKKERTYAAQFGIRI